MEKNRQPNTSVNASQSKTEKKTLPKKNIPEKKNNDLQYSGHRIQGGYMLVL